MKDFIEQINENGKVAIGLTIAEKMFELIDIKDEEYKLGRESLDSCWMWLKDKKIEANDLCDYIDDEDCDDIDDIAYREKDMERKYAWNTLYYAIAYTSWHAYNNEDNNIPGVLVNVSDEVLIYIVQDAVKSESFKIESLNEVKKHLLENYPVGSTLEEKPIIKEEIMKMIDNNY